MSIIVERFNKIKSNIAKTDNNNFVKIVAVSKTFSLNHIMPLIEHGHVHFGENKVQEAELKWKEIKKKNTNIKLHMVGKLQTNKVKTALEIFDYIHSIDNYKLAEKISKYEKELGKKVKTFVQVNIGDESQKNGINPKYVNEFVNHCRKNLFLNIVGLMCLPPLDKNPEKYFLHLDQLRKQTNLAHLSMGMTNDYQIAVNCGATFLRIGSKIFGKRNTS